MRIPLSRTSLTFLGVGGVGYVVDVLAFNVLLSVHPFADRDPTLARSAAVAIAMVVTYIGNRTLTWRDQRSERRAREIASFIVVNLVGLGASAAMLALTHDVLGMTSRLEDNLSANVVGLALGTAIRYWAYQRLVFVGPSADPSETPPPRPAYVEPRCGG